MKSITRAFLFSFFALLISPAFAAKILVIESYHAQYQWDIGYKKAIEDKLANNNQLHYFEMDTKRLPKSQYLHRAKLAWQRYIELKPDVVILADDNALKFVGPMLAKTDTPVVYLGINNNPRNYAISGAPNITGVLERPLVKRSIMTITDILPETSKLLILFDSSNTAHTSLENVFNNESLTSISHVQVDIQLIEKYELWQQQIMQAQDNQFDAIVIGLFHTLRDSFGEHVDEENVLAWSSANSQLPIFALWDFAVGQDKTIGGLVLESYQQGLEASKLVEKILSGTAPQQLFPTTSVPGVYMFSRTQLARFNITLPQQYQTSAVWVK